MEPRIALVTGASRGIGATIARRLARAGMVVVVHYHSGELCAERVVTAIRQEGGQALAVGADVRVREEVDRMVGRIQEETRHPVNVLVNNARQLAPHRPFLELTWANIQDQIDVIFRGSFHCCQAVLPGMIASGGGRIITMLTTILVEPDWRWHAYGAAKAALANLSRNLAAEFAAKGITVNTVSPGWIRTERATQHTPDYQEDYLRRTPLGRLATADEVAEAVLFYAGEGAGAITGTDMLVCGGRVMA